MKTGLAIYSSDLGKLVSFYQDVFGFAVIEVEPDFALLEHGEFELVILETDISRSLNNQSSTPVPREATPLKPTFFVDDYLQDISKKVIAHGGSMREPKDWTFGGKLVCDGWDCEGNIFQLRSPMGSD